MLGLGLGLGLASPNAIPNPNQVMEEYLAATWAQRRDANGNAFS